MAEMTWLGVLAQAQDTAGVKQVLAMGAQPIRLLLAYHGGATQVEAVRCQPHRLLAH